MPAIWKSSVSIAYIQQATLAYIDTGFADFACSDLVFVRVFSKSINVSHSKSIILFQWKKYDLLRILRKKRIKNGLFLFENLLVICRLGQL